MPAYYIYSGAQRWDRCVQKSIYLTDMFPNQSNDFVMLLQSMYTQVYIRMTLVKTNKMDH